MAALVFAWPLGGRADEVPAFSLQGFGTLGLARTTSQEARFVRDLTQPTGAGRQWDGRIDSVLGLQANWQFSSSLEFVAQAVSRFRYDQTYTPELSWAFFRYDPNPQLSLRAGRLGTEFFMMADSRMVGYSYLPVRPPGDFFWYLPFLGIDGADVAMIFPVGEDVLRGKLYYGVSDANIPLADRQWKIDGSKMAGGYVDYQSGPWLFRVSYANILFSNDMPIDDILGRTLPPGMAAQARSFLAAANTRSHYYSIGVIYDRGPWQVQLMLNDINQGSQIFQSSKGGYALVGYRVSAYTPYFGYSRIFSDSRGNTLNPVVARIMADSHVDQYTTILGVRWDVARNIALKAQWDGIHGQPDSIFPYRLETDAFKGKLDVFSVTMDFVF
ncbi:MAG: hypothetical protein D3M94_12655 [Rhodocyclales bacterium GT-UBC]|nr:MAG: hypothetical protein D3M94_12655 [Rhodocyclales bacterium GT-UBC]